jgi:hypothetical protein
MAGLLAAATDAADGMCRAADLAGTWEGTWESCSSGHHGKLRATIVPTADGRYCATFTGTFFKFMPFKYQVILTAEEGEEGGVDFSGQSDLGRLAGGCYQYSGQADECTFEATYHSCKDHGCFSMKRVANPCCRRVRRR